MIARLCRPVFEDTAQIAGGAQGIRARPENNPRRDAMELKTKKVIIIGDRDGVPGEAIKLCAESAGAEVVYAATECFV